MDWNTPLYFPEYSEEGMPIGFSEYTLRDFEDRAMLPREHGVDFRYFVTDDSDGLWWVMKCVVQGARPIRISHHESEDEAKRVAMEYNVQLAYEKAEEEGAFFCTKEEMEENIYAESICFAGGK